MNAHHVGFFDTITRDLGGKGKLRLIIQPAVAILLGIRLGIADARAREQPFGVRVFQSRHQIVRRALSDVIIPFCVALVVDGILQYYTLGRVRPVAAVVVALLIVWLPFAIARGLANRIATGHREQHGGEQHA